MKKIWMLLVFCLLIGVQIVKASDVKVKLNSADGSTSFQVRDSADVVVSSITSDGVASFSAVIVTGTHSGALNISAGALTNMTVKNEDLIITSTFTQVASISTIAENTTFADLNPFCGTLNVTEQPALIYAVFSSSVCRQNLGWPMWEFRILIDGNQSGSHYYLCPVDRTGDSGGVSVAAVWRVTATGNKEVKIQQRHYGDITGANATFSTFWIPCSP